MPKNRRRKNHRNKNKINNSNSNNNDNNKSNQNNIEEKSNISDGVIDVDADEEREHVIEETQQQQHQLRYLQQENEKEESETNSNIANSQEEQSIRELSGNYVGDHPTCISRGGGGGKQEENENILPSCSLQEESNPSEEDENKNNKDQYTHTDDSSCINNDAPNREHDPKYSNKLAETFEELSSPNAATDTEKIAGDELVKSNDNEEILSKKETNKNNENCLKNISSVTKNIVNLRSEKNLLPGNDKKDITKTGTKHSKENAPPEAENSTEETENSTTTVHESSTSSSFISSSSDTDTLKGEELSSSAGIECDIISIDSRDLHDDITKDQDGKNILKSNSESSINNENILSPKSPSTPIKHPIIQEAILTLYSYRVESPKPMKLTKPLQMKKSRSLDDDDVTIQEISDNSSAGDLTDSNQPLVSEAESEAETVDTENFEPVKEKSSTQSQFKILNIQTIPLGNEKEAEITVSRVDNKEEISANEGHVIHSTVSLSLQSVQEINEKSDVKARRAKKRAAIESHFMPQFLNPRYLDSIKEENSDISDCDRKSDPREDHDFTPLSRSNSDDVVVDSAKIAKKANAIFPKINLDLSTCPKKRISNIRSPKTDAIREESPCLVVEAKIIEQKNNIQESCSSWTTKEAPEPTAAEIVYIDSASSSSSDLMDLDYTGGDEADTEDTHDNFDVEIGATALNCSFNNSQNKYEIGMKTTTGTSTEEAVISSSVQEGHPPTTESKFSSSNSDSGSKHTQDDFQTSVAIEKSILTCIAGNESKDNEINVENSENDEIIKEFSSPCTTDAVDNSKVQPEEICAHLAEDELLLNKSDYIEESEETKTMDDLDEKFDQVLNENQLVDFDNISCASLITDLDVSSSNLITDLDASSDGGECNENDNNSKNIKDNHEDSPVNNVNGKCKSEGRNSDNDSLEYSRQDSNGSHASTRSQSTTHSQCTTINKGSLSNTDLTAFDNENSIAGPADDNNLINEPNDLTSETASIKSLRQLSLEVLSSMPYGGEVLEELAKVSASLSHLAQQHHNQATSLLDSCCDQDQYQKEGEDMPYPVPELPKIEKLQLPNNVPSDPSKIVNIKFVSTLIKSPSPPPIPSPPREDAWYGIPTEEDPNVLLCLSPSQRDQLEKESNGANRKSVEKLIKPDHLLDMHKKFIERRGYHEPLPPTPQSNEKNAHRKSSTEKCENIMSPINLRKSMTPPPVPPRPGQQLLSSSSLLNVNENEISKSEEKIFSDKNNHRLLAIIRGDSEQSDLRTSENISKKVEHSFGTKETLHKNLVINNKNQSVTRNLSDQTTQTTVKTDLTLSPKKTSSTNTTLTFPSSTENPTKEMPPTIEKDIIFEYLNRENSLKDQLKRCSNIETLSGSGYRDNELCAQLNRPKRYSNIETSSFESKKHIENGNVVYEYNDSNKQKYSDGNCDTPKILENLKINFDELMKKGNRDTCSKDKVNKERFHPQREHREKDVQHEFFQDRYSDQQDFKNRNTLNDQQKTAYLNSTASSTSDAFSYDEFRRRAKETAERARNEFFAREKLFKDFEDISSILKDDMFTINDSTTSTSKYKTAETSTGTPKIPNIPIEEDESKLWKEFHDKVSSTATTTKEEKKHFVEKTERKTFQIPIKVEGEFSSNILKNVPGESFNEQKEFVDKFMSQQQRHVASQPQLRNLENKKHLDSKVYEIPMNIEEKSSIGSELNSTEQTEETHRVRTIPILMERSYSLQDSCKGHRERVIPIQVETTSKVFHSQPNTPSPYYENFMVHSKTTPTSPISPTLLSRQEKIFAERKLSNQDVSECIRYTDDLGSSENITRPFWKEMTICHGRRANVRAPRLTASTSNLSNSRDYLAKSTEQLIDKKDRYISCHSVIDQTPITQHVSNSKRSSVPRELYSTSNTAASNNSQIDYLKQREYELKVEFEKLENERRRLMQEMEEMNTKKLHKDSALYHSIGGRLPVLSEEEAFRKQMHNEWLDKVAEREERRLQKIIKISKPANEVGASSVETPSLSHNVNTVYQQSSLEKNKILKSASNLDISDEFLRRVKERRTKLCMPSDSEWDSGAESQQPTTETSQQQQSEDEIKNVKIIEGQTETDLKHLPKHLREFVEFTNKIEKEHCNDNETKNDVNQQQQFNRKEFVKSENNNSSLIQRNEKSSIFTKTVKTSMFNGNCDDKNNCESFDKKSSIKNSGPERNDGRYLYKTNGYMSEPEPNYDSDYSTMKYNTLDRKCTSSKSSYQQQQQQQQQQQTQQHKDDSFPKSYGTMPNPVKSGSPSYKNQPGRIEDYVPGRSSVSEKEKKEWWDEVMEIFNGHLEQQKLSNNYTEGYLSRALKEQGYESDSNLVFRKKEDSQFAPLSPIEQKQAYRNVQAGGEPPLQGFRKPAPEKPKESPHRYFESDVNIHYKTPIRYEYKETIPEEELSRRQAEAMKKLYQEERRRKYLQELQDMNNRRHTDNFTPTQKSPIPLNRYDDFNADLPAGTTTSGGGYRQTSSSSSSKTVARALYNFQGQTARELSFKKGDIIYIRRQVDKNWYEGEHNAMIGLLPANYVEVISKDGSRQTPKKLSEGQARAKFSFQAQSGIELSLNKGELVTLTRRVDENWFEGRIANRKGIFPVSYVEVLTDIGSEDFVLQNSTTLSSKPVGTPASHSLITYPLTPQQQSLDTIRTNLNNELNALSSSQSHHHPTTNGGIIKEMKTIHKTQVLHVDTDTEPVAYRALYKYRPQNNDELELQEGDIVYVLEKCDDGWYVGTSQRTGYFGTFPGNYVERV